MRPVTTRGGTARVLSAEPGTPHVDESTVVAWVRDQVELALLPAAHPHVGAERVTPLGIIQFNPRGLEALLIAHLPYLFYVPYLLADIQGTRWHIDARLVRQMDAANA